MAFTRDGEWMESRCNIDTSLFPPVSRQKLIVRSRLVDPGMLGRKLTLVTAPAGFGKTTVLGQLYQELKQSRVTCCWCSLQFGDNDPARFLRHFITSVKNELPTFGDEVLNRINTSVPDDICDAADLIVGDIHLADAETVLFMDDFHHALSAQVIDFVNLLLEISPATFRLVIGSRIRPALHLSSLKLQDQLNDIDVNQLRFDKSETREFLCSVTNIDLTNSQLSTLFAHSEGWVAGLQLASFSLRNPDMRDAFIASFSGSLREISDYLTTDVLSRQRREVRDFLLQTSICNRLNADLCKVLTGNEDAQALLTHVEANNLFLVPLDYDGTWYRYHHLFQEFLFAQLRRNHPSEIPELYRKASRWFAASGFMNDAIEYALLAGDIHLVGRLVHQGPMESLTMEGKMVELLSWVNRIPPNYKIRFPRLLIQECLALAHLCRPVEADRAATQARTSIRELETNGDYAYGPQEIERIKAEEALLPMLVAFARDDPKTDAVSSLMQIRTKDDLIRAMTDNFIGYISLQNCELQVAQEYLNKGRFHHIAQKTYYGAVFSDCFIAMSLKLRFRFYKAFDRVRAAEDLIARIPGGHPPAMAKARVMQASILYEWNRIEEAMSLLDEHLQLVDRVGHISITQYGYLAEARCHAALGDFDKANRSLTRCLRLSQHMNTSFIDLVVHAERLRFAGIGGGRRKFPGRKLDPRQALSLVASLRKKWNRVTFARLLVLQNLAFYTKNYRFVRETIKPLLELCYEKNLILYGVRFKLLSIFSALEMANGKSELEYEELARLVSSVRPENAVRAILDTGNQVYSALEVLETKCSDADGSIDRKFLRRLLETHSTGNASNPHERSARHPGRTRTVARPLNNREIEIMELLAEGKSNARIREQLFISENTVKWHLKNIFAKLRVNNRTAAVVTAQQKQIIGF